MMTLRPYGNDPQVRPEVGTGPTLLRRVAEELATFLDSLEEIVSSCRTVLGDETVDCLEVFLCSRPVGKLKRHDGALLPILRAVFRAAV